MVTVVGGERGFCLESVDTSALNATAFSQQEQQRLPHSWCSTQYGRELGVWRHHDCNSNLKEHLSLGEELLALRGACATKGVDMARSAKPAKGAPFEIKGV